MTLYYDFILMILNDSSYYINKNSGTIEIIIIFWEHEQKMNVHYEEVFICPCISLTNVIIV